MFKKVIQNIIFPLIVLLIGFFTYFYDYSYPSNLFWDENYHIASAEKYLQGVFFMEPHPPLGKLFIALGEKLMGTNKNIDKSEFTKTDYIKSVPKGYSFEGVRFFPALFGMITGLLFYFTFYFLFNNKYLAFLFSGLYLFENAYITQSRSAMLDSIQVFFLMVPIVFFVFKISRDKLIKYYDYIILGLLIGLGVSVKVNSMILFILPLFFVVYEYFFKNIQIFKIKEILKYFGKGILFLLGFIFSFGFVRYIHISIGKTPAHGNYYKATEFYKEAIESNQTSNLIKFPRLLLDHINFISHYQKGVPALDVCKKGENGSYPLNWIIGNKAINYRREAINNRQSVRYMYFQGNPIVWWSALFAVVLAISLILGNIFYNLKITNKKIYFYIILFLFMYIGYMYSVMQIKRVMYLYHYLIPLCFGIILIGLIIYYAFETEFTSKETIKLGKFSIPMNYMIWLTLFLYIFLVFTVYIYFSPLSYYNPLSSKHFQERIWFDFRGLKPVK